MSLFELEGTGSSSLVGADDESQTLTVCKSRAHLTALPPRHTLYNIIWLFILI